MDVLSAAVARENQGEKIIHLELGEPASPPPLQAREAAIRALSGGRVSYTEALGRPSLRARIARFYRDSYGVEVSPERVIVTTGSSGGFILSFLALFDVGARVLISSPGYPAYRNIMQALGIEAVPIPTTAASGHIVTAGMIEAAHARQPIDGVLLMSPSNPTGAMTSPEALAAICETCDRLGVAFISDEIYHGLTYAMPSMTALASSSRAIVINSFSKYFCMTGWRVGWMIAPEELVRPLERLQQSLSISVPTLSQIAAEAAFEAREELELVKAGYVANRDILMERLPKIGLGSFAPMDGAFYAYVDVGHLTNDSVSFCRAMLDECGVATTPGMDFDRETGHRALRISYAGPRADIVDAMDRMGEWLRQR
jgi:aspartate/methionine/tyrosine aminotransferase